MLAEPWGSPNSPPRDGPSSLLGDETGWHGPAEGTRLSVRGPLHCPHVPVGSLRLAASPDPLGIPNLSRNLPFLLPSPPPPLQPARLYDATAGPLLGGGDFQKLYLYMHAQRSGHTGCIYTVLDATGWRSGAGVPAAAPLGRAGTRHTQRQGMGDGDGDKAR